MTQFHRKWHHWQCPSQWGVILPLTRQLMNLVGNSWWELDWHHGSFCWCFCFQEQNLNGECILLHKFSCLKYKIYGKRQLLLSEKSHIKYYYLVISKCLIEGNQFYQYHANVICYIWVNAHAHAGNWTCDHFKEEWVSHFGFISKSAWSAVFGLLSKILEHFS